MEVTIKLNLLDLVDSDAQLAKAQQLVNYMKAKSTTTPVEVEMTEEEGENEEVAAKVGQFAAYSLNPSSSSSRVFAEIIELIEQKGQATLGEIAQKWQVDTKTIRGHLLNGMRSLKHRNQEVPFTSVWNPDLHCVVYTAK